MTIGFDELYRLATISISLFALLWSVSTWVYVRNGTRDKEVDAAIKALQETVTKIEGEIEHMPSHDDISRIHERIDLLAEGISNLRGEFSGAKATLNLIHEYLMKERRS